MRAEPKLASCLGHKIFRSGRKGATGAEVNWHGGAVDNLVYHSGGYGVIDKEKPIFWCILVAVHGFSDPRAVDGVTLSELNFLWRSRCCEFRFALPSDDKPKRVNDRLTCVGKFCLAGSDLILLLPLDSDGVRDR